MGRPLKVQEKDIRYIIEHWDKESAPAIGRKIKVHHTTVLAWGKRLGLPRKQSSVDGMGISTLGIVDKLRKEYAIGEDCP